ncbi:MAG: alpha/beta fold hydrolase [Lautropia sp.]|nr:alpha/beta fold hydrolase [Lautropia sp.]
MNQNTSPPQPLHLRLQRPGAPTPPFPACRLLILGFAGGAVTSLLPLATAFADDIDTWGIEYPGHGMQWQRPLHHTLQPMLDDLLESIDVLDDIPLVLLGYSMGAQLCHRLAQLRPHSIRGLVLLSARPPQDPDLSRPSREVGDEELTVRLQKLGGMPAGVLAHEGLMSLFLPVIRADLAICAELGHSGIRAARTPLDCPVLALQGNHDPMLQDTSMHQWLGLAPGLSGRNAFRSYEGGHFFHSGRERQLATDIETWIRSHVLSLRVASHQPPSPQPTAFAP